MLLVFAGKLVLMSRAWIGPSIAADARKSRLTSVALLGGRGEITDADGTALAASVERYDIQGNQKLVAVPE